MIDRKELSYGVEVHREIKTIKVRLYCPVCIDGELVCVVKTTDRKSQKSNYYHECNNCEYYSWLDLKYPYIREEEV